MGIDSLRDLALAGVKWELSDAVTQHQKEILDNENSKTSTLNPKISATQSVAVPAKAPIDICAAKTVTADVEDIDALCRAIEDFNHPLKMFAKNTILPTGNGELLVITDAPSSDDDETGRILSGAAGEIFDKMVDAIGLSRKDITICPLVFWRAPGGRTPTDEELEIARPFTQKLIELLQPKMILTLGTLAMQQSSDLGSRFPFFSIPHPNYLILKPDSKKTAWEELQKLQKTLQNGENKV
ncbi:MAG: uracil-DNA glycosylase [Alphaproteobacteria bacterium]|nr:uracil-DNA glycosylase [Alphaproteobacteria bacterium]